MKATGEPEPLTVKCPVCGAPKNSRCVDEGRIVPWIHVGRLDAWRAVSPGSDKE